MKKKFLSFLLLLSVAISCAFGSVACDKFKGKNPEGPAVEDPNAPLFSPKFEVDYAGKVTLDMSSTATRKKEVTVKIFVDGDTTHFNMASTADMPEAVQHLGYLKARYAAVNTPESTGTIEKWGKDASDFTKSKLSTAESIVLESDSAEWEADSTGERFLSWIWYKPAGATKYRNLNIELLQYGLALPSKTDDVRYSTDALAAITQAKAEKLYLYSNKKDPDFYIGEAIPLTLKELRTNIEDYVGKRVVFEGVVAADYAQSVYVESYDEESNMYFGMTAYYGYTPNINTLLKVGNHVRMSGVVNFYETGGTYQISDLKYNLRDKTDPDSISLVDAEKHEVPYTELTYEQFTSTVTIEKEVVDPETEETTTQRTDFFYAKLVLSTSISMKNLRVVDVYVTKKGDSEGAVSLTCKDAKNHEITVRTGVLKDEDGRPYTQTLAESKFLNKTIDVKGIVGYYNNDSDYEQTFPYQIQAFALDYITIR